MPTVPTWTVSGNNAGSTSALVLGFNPTACSPWGIVDFSGGTATNNPSVTQMANSTFGLTGTGPNDTNDTWYWSKTDTTNALTFQTASYHSMTVNDRMCNSGVTYSSPATQLGIRLATATAGANTAYLQFNPPWTGNGVASSAKLKFGSASIWFRTSVVATDTVNHDIFTIFGSPNFSNVILLTNGTIITLGLEGTGSSVTTISSNTWYKLCLSWVSGGTGQFSVYDASGTQVGSTQTLAEGAGSISSFQIGNTHAGTTTSSGVHDFGGWKICYSSSSTGCPFPLVL
jgi:hypothetical protein